MKIILQTVLAFIVVNVTIAQSQDSVFHRLLSGNKRFMNQMALHPHDDFQAIMRTSAAQKPFALVHACSDSRVAPELIFDQGIGDLFVTRVAGNVMDDGGLGSIEYAIEHLGVRFILILGHSKCGAVSATVSGKKPSGHISWLVNQIAPSYQKVFNLTGDKLDLTIKENVKHSMNEVMMDRELLDLAIRNEIIIAGALYHVEDGSIEIIVPPHVLDKTPSQKKQ